MSRIFRFAPSPNGLLHLGHALSVLTNADRAQASGGQLFLRHEDIDVERCRPEFERSIEADLAWLGLAFDGPPVRQSERFSAYARALDRLRVEELVYPAFVTRSEVRAFARAETERTGRPWPSDPDGAPLYPPGDRDLSDAARRARIMAGAPHAWRLDMAEAVRRVGVPTFHESGPALTLPGWMTTDPTAWGDVVLARRDVPTSYHLAVVVDDAEGGVTDVVRGLDILPATAVHRVLQAVLGLSAPRYHHHRLLLGPDGRKLSKSAGDTGLAELRARGLTPADIRNLVGL